MIVRKASYCFSKHELSAKVKPYPALIKIIITIKVFHIRGIRRVIFWGHQTVHFLLKCLLNQRSTKDKVQSRLFVKPLRLTRNMKTLTLSPAILLKLICLKWRYDRERKEHIHREFFQIHYVFLLFFVKYNGHMR